jgi:hypothetical protein
MVGRRSRRGHDTAEGPNWSHLLKAVGAYAPATGELAWLSPWRLLLRPNYERFLAHWCRGAVDTGLEIPDESALSSSWSTNGASFDTPALPETFTGEEFCRRAANGQRLLVLAPEHLSFAVASLENLCVALETIVFEDACDANGDEASRSDSRDTSVTPHLCGERVTTALYSVLPDVSYIPGVLYAWMQIGLQLREQDLVLRHRRKRNTRFRHADAAADSVDSRPSTERSRDVVHEEAESPWSSSTDTENGAYGSRSPASEAEGSECSKTSPKMEVAKRKENRKRAGMILILACRAYWLLLRVIPDIFVPFVFKDAVQLVQTMARVQDPQAHAEKLIQDAFSALAELFDAIRWIRYLLDINCHQPARTRTSDQFLNENRDPNNDDSTTEGMMEALGNASELILRQIINFETITSRSTKILTAKQNLFRNAWRNMVMIAAVLSERATQSILQSVWKIFMEGLSPKRTGAVAKSTTEMTISVPGSSLRPMTTLVCELVRAAIEEAPKELVLNIRERISGAVLVLLQHLGVNAPETADRRSVLVHCMLVFFNILEPIHIYRFCYFIERLSRHPRAAIRCLALELAASIEEEPDDDPNKGEEDVAVAWMLFQQVIWARTRDRQAAVRARALASTALCLNQLAESNRTRALTLLHNERKLLQSRLCDEKAAVRRNALLLAAAVLEMLAQRSHWTNTARDLLQAVQERCTDTHIAVRLVAVQQITNFAASGTGTYRERCIQAWLDSVLQLANDPEQSVTQACLDGFITLLFPSTSPLPGSSAAGNGAVNHEFAQRLVAIAAAKADPRRPLLFHLLHRLGQQSPFPDAFSHWLCDQAHKQLHPGAWSLLAQLTSHDETVRLAVVRWILDPNPHILLDLTPEDPVANELTLVVANAAHGSVHAAVIHEDARAMLFQLRGDPGRIPALVQCLKQTGSNRDWPRELAQACSELLSLEPTEYACSSLEERACALTAWGELIFSGLVAADERLRVRAEAMLADSERNSESLRAYALLTLGKLCLRGDARLAQSYTSVFLHELETSPSTVLRNNAVLILADMCRVFSWLADQYTVRFAAAMRDPSVLVRRQTITVLTGLLEEEYIKPKKDGLVFLFLSVTQDEDYVVSKIARHCLERMLFPRYPAARVHQFLESLFYFNDCTVHARYNQHAGAYQSTTERARFTLPEQAGARHRIYLYLLNNATDEQVLMIADRLAAEIIGGLLDGELGPFPDVLDSHSSVHNLVHDTLHLLASRTLSSERWQRHSRMAATSALECPAEAEPAMMWLRASPGPSSPAATAKSVTISAEPRPNIETNTLRSKSNPSADASKSTEGTTGEAAMRAFRGHLLPVLARRSLEQTILPTLMELRQQLERIQHPLVGQVIRAIREQVRPHVSDVVTLLHTDIVFARELAHELRKETLAKRRGQVPKVITKRSETPLGEAPLMTTTPVFTPKTGQQRAGAAIQLSSIGPDSRSSTRSNQALSPHTPATQLVATRIGGGDLLTSLRGRRQSRSGRRANSTDPARRVTFMDPSMSYNAGNEIAGRKPRKESIGNTGDGGSCSRTTPRQGASADVKISIDRRAETPLATDFLDAVDALSVSCDISGSADRYRRLRHQRRRRTSHPAYSRGAQ